MNKPPVTTLVRLRTIAVALLLGIPSAALASPSANAPRATASRAATTTFHFQDIPVRSALQLIAEEGGFNLVVSDSVQGNITLRLTDVTWEQALEIVMRMKGLQHRVDSGASTLTVTGS